MKHIIYSVAVVFLLLGTMTAPHAYAETASTTTSASSIEAMMTKIKTLMAQVTELQKQLSAAKGEVKTILQDSISTGMNSEDVKKIQELLATDETIYPEGKVTGYFGPLTKEALKRFQKRHELETTGSIDTETKDLLNEYLHEGFGNKIPTGLLKAPGIVKKVESRYAQGCEKVEGGDKGMGVLCKKLKKAPAFDEDENEDEDETEDELEDEDEMEADNEDRNNNGKHRPMIRKNATSTYAVAVTIENGSSTIFFSFKGTEYEVTADSIRRSDVLSQVAEKLNISVQKLDYKLVREIEKALEIARRGN